MVTTRERDRDRDGPRPRRREGPSGGAVALVLAALGGGVLLVVLGCVALAYWLISSAPAPTPVQVGGPGLPPPAPPNGPGGNPAWRVRADPSPLPPAGVTGPGRVARLGATHPHILVAPGSPSPFVASGASYAPDQRREVWDLRTMEKVGQVRGLQLRTLGVLSPDGAHLAGIPQGHDGFVVCSCKDGAKAFELRDNDLWPVGFYDFAGPGKFVVTTVMGRKACHVFEVPGGRKLRTFEIGDHQKGEPCATSPGGRYLAVPFRGSAHLYDLNEGAAAGALPLPADWPAARLREMAFSADGKELAILCLSPRGASVYAWALEDNRLACDHLIAAEALSRLTTSEKYSGRHLEWLEDGNGWLFQGEVLIDRRDGKPVWRLGADDAGHARHVVGSGHVACFKGEVGSEGLELVEVRRGEGDLAELAPGAPPAAPSKEEQAALAAIRKVGNITRARRWPPAGPVVEVLLVGDKVTDAELSAVSAFPRLRKLGVVQTKVTDDGLAVLEKLPRLEELYLSGRKGLTEKAIARVGKLTGLRALSLSFPAVTNDSVAHIKGLTGLRKLSLNTTGVDDGALAHLGGMTELRELDLMNVGSITERRRVTDAGLARIVGLTKLEVLVLTNSSVTGKGLAHLKRMAGLRVLDLFNTEVDDDGLAHLKGLTRLEKLRLSSTNVSDRGLESLAGLAQLRELDLGLTKVTDRGMAHLKGLGELRSLRLASTAVGDEGLARLKGLTRLTHLDIATGKVTDAGLAHLAGLKELTHLSVSGTGITDAGLIHLERLPRLGTINLYGTRVTDAGLARLKKALPRASVYRN